MPELPDVAVFEVDLDATALHEPLARVRVRDDGLPGAIGPRSIGKALRRAIRCRVDAERFPRKALRPHRAPGERCPRCPGRIRRETIAGLGACVRDRRQARP